MFRTLMLLPVLAILASPSLDAKDGHKHKHKMKKDTEKEWRKRTDDGDFRRRTTEGWRNRTETERRRGGVWNEPMIPRDTRGHVPHDANGDGVVSRHEWPGNDQSWRNQDRNGDGVIDDLDRRMAPRGARKARRDR